MSDPTDETAGSSTPAPASSTPTASTPAKSSAPAPATQTSAPVTIDVRECAVCGRSTALAMCQHCGFDPVHAQERIAVKAERDQAQLAAA